MFDWVWQLLAVLALLVAGGAAWLLAVERERQRDERDRRLRADRELVETATRQFQATREKWEKDRAIDERGRTDFQADKSAW